MNKKFKKAYMEDDVLIGFTDVIEMIGWSGTAFGTWKDAYQAVRQDNFDE